MIFYYFISLPGNINGAPCTSGSRYKNITNPKQTKFIRLSYARFLFRKHVMNMLSQSFIPTLNSLVYSYESVDSKDKKNNSSGWIDFKAAFFKKSLNYFSPVEFGISNILICVLLKSTKLDPFRINNTILVF